jgi:hypothetical protein
MAGLIAFKVYNANPLNPIKIVPSPRLLKGIMDQEAALRGFSMNRYENLAIKKINNAINGTDHQWTPMVQREIARMPQCHK